MKQRGDVPPKTQLSERRVGYRVCDVEEWLDKRRRQVTEEAAR
jgi:predicted DNA-binding transcriptional regulator AlpA